MIKRGTPPKLHHWTVPGGKVNFGETCEQAVIREIREEVGLDIQPGPVLKVVDLLVPNHEEEWDPKTMSVDLLAYHFCVIEYLAVVPPDTEGVAGSDALELLWIDQKTLKNLQPIASSQIVPIVNSAFKLLEQSHLSKE